MGIRDYIKQRKESIKGRLEIRKQEKLADKAIYLRAKSEARQVARAQREKEIIATAKYRAQLAGQRSREYIKGGGFMGQLGRQVSTARKQVATNRAKSGMNFLSSNRINMGPTRDITAGRQVKQTKKKKSKRSIIINL